MIRWVFTKIDIHLVTGRLQQAKLVWLLPAVVLFILSKLASAIRLNQLFEKAEVWLSGRVNRQLYWLGMFYNLFLPGGIGGDAYKVIWLKRNHASASAITVTKAVLLDRFSGMLAAVVIMLAMCPFIGFLPVWVQVGALPAAVLSYVVYIWMVKKQFSVFYRVLAATSRYSLGVQLLQCFCVWCLMQAFSVHTHLPEYMLLFLLSSLVAVLPFTLGGIGARELVFLYGSRYLLLNQDVSVIISLLFYLITAGVSLAGVWYFVAGTFSLKSQKSKIKS